MNDQMQALARRAVACRHWRWMPGMLCIWPNGNSYRVGQVADVNGADSLPNYPSNGWGDEYPDRTLGHPDLDDPATLGCLLALVREAWGDEWLACKGDYSPHGSTWVVYSGKPHGRRFLTQVAGIRYPTEAEALIAALEAAP